MPARRRSAPVPRVNTFERPAPRALISIDTGLVGSRSLHAVDVKMLRSARALTRHARPQRRRLSGGAPTKHGVSQELRPIHQDMPPPGGYPSVLFAKAQKDRGPEGWKIWAAAMAVVAVGFYRVGQTNLERNAAKREKREARMNMVPYLQAEEDRRFCASEDAEDAEEARVMEGVKGWTVGESVYSSGVWEPPSRTDHPRPTF